MQARILLIVLLLGISLLSRALSSVIETTVQVEYIKANGNQLDSVQDELREILSSDLVLLNGANLIITQNSEPSSFFKVTLSAKELDPDKAKRVFTLVDHYLSQRLGGHSKAYSYYLMEYGQNAWPADLKNLAENPEVREAVAFPWINRSVQKSLFFWGPDTPKVRTLFVIDGEVAWMYCVSNTAPPGHSLQFRRFDAIEFSPAATQVLQRSFKRLTEREKQSKKRWNSIKWWDSFKAQVARETDLQWRTAYDLNPEIMFN